MACNPLTFLALLCAFYAPTASALYIQAGPPQGWSGGATSGLWTGTANPAATYSGSQVRAMASINMQGRSYALASSFKLGPTAARTAAAAIYLNPYLRTAATVAGWLGLAGLAYDQASGLWTKPDSTYGTESQSDGYQYNVGQADSQWFGTAFSACSHAVAVVNARQTDGWTLSNPGVQNGACRYDYKRPDGSLYARNGWVMNKRTSACPSGWYVTPAGCVQTPPPKTVTQDEAIDELTKHPMPADVPRHIPAPLPVEQPVIQPTFIPSGDPITNPKFNPSEAPSPSNPPMVQPGVDVKPAPTPTSPWQVDATPVNRPITDPTATPDREPVPIPDPGGSGTGNPPTENKPQETPGLCDLYPNIIACMDAGQADTPPELPTKEIDFNFQVEGGFSGARTCPAPKEISRGIVLDYSGLCNVLDIARNILLTFAWLSAALIVLRGRAD